MTTGSSTYDNTGDGLSSPLLPTRPTGEGDPPATQQTESVLHFMSRTAWWIMPLLLVVIGAGLGWADKSATGTETALRLPALIVALLLFSQGLADLRAGRKRSILEEVKAEVGVALIKAERELEATRTELTKVKVHLEKIRGGEVTEEEAAVAATPPAQPEKAWLSLPGSHKGQDRMTLTSLILMALGVWLGVELLTVTAPANLTVLSLIGVFMVFSAGARAIMPESS